MARTEAKLLSAEEFAASTQDADWKEELIDGVVHRSRPPSMLHGIACANAASLFGNYSDRKTRGRAAIGSGLIVSRDPDSVLAPDVQFFSADRPPDVCDGWPTIPPMAIVEVMDGSTDFSHIIMKVPLYLSFGVELILVVRPLLKDIGV